MAEAESRIRGQRQQQSKQEHKVRRGEKEFEKRHGILRRRADRGIASCIISTGYKWAEDCQGPLYHSDIYESAGKWAPVMKSHTYGSRIFKMRNEVWGVVKRAVVSKGYVRVGKASRETAETWQEEKSDDENRARDKKRRVLGKVITKRQDNQWSNGVKDGGR